ncbi:fungal specific transcription factor domain-containing protein [Colletotrichum nymphaeae SA-01]|uniref:Fungal specific transcription factor domain-containing protein n=1 Tax=Colletotrichum nymphaeae SA-01 TaxID=1460502 RepID=A0A135SY67_9PEZI|nr:fungal specific transcription factor domain-containing protein [Colletotrichum nymphaeae SA-01]
MGSGVQPTHGAGGRPATVRACDMCRKKKIRCEPTAQGCAQCTKYLTRCHFTQIAMKRKPRRPAGFKYIAQLEERLSALENMNFQGEKSTVPGNNLREEKTNSAVAPSTSALTTLTRESNSWIPMNESHILSQHTGSPEIDLDVALRTYNHDQLDFSANRGFVIDPIAGSPWPHLSPESRPDSLPGRGQLPLKAVALGLVKEAFDNYNRFLPLFNEEDFLIEFHLKYSTSNPEDAGWWACLNVVLSIAHRLRGLRTLDPTHENNLADVYTKNALDVVSELNVASISAVQALVGMACILQGTPNPELASMLVAAALRLAQTMNLHREASDPSLTENQAEIRRRVFWKVYVLDKDISLRTCRPFSLDDDDMDVRLPSNTNLETCNVELFNHRIGLAIIQGQVYKQLYSIRAGRQSEAQRAIAAQDLTSVLSYWKSSAQLELLEDSLILSGSQVAGEMIHKVVLRLTYIHCLTMIDRHLCPATRSPLDQEISQSGASLLPGSLCLAESRQAIRLIEAIPHGDCSCIWMLLHSFFAAASSMLYNLIHNPTSPSALSDLHLLEPFLHLLDTLAKNPGTYAQSEELRRMHNTCTNLHNEANKAVRLFRLEHTASFA